MSLLRRAWNCISEHPGAISFGTLVVTMILVAITATYYVVDLKHKEESARIELESWRAEQERPRLVHRTVWDVAPTEADWQAVEGALNQLYERFFIDVDDHMNTYPELRYDQAIPLVLPIKVPLPSAQAGSLSITVRNHGEIAEKQIRVTIAGITAISDCSVAEAEPYRRIEGGEGENHVMYEIERLVQDDEFTINVTFEGGTQVEQSVELRQRDVLLNLERIAEVGPQDAIGAVLTNLEVRYIRSPGVPAPEVKVTGERGPATPIEKSVRTGIQDLLEWYGDFLPGDVLEYYRDFPPSEWRW